MEGAFRNKKRKFRFNFVDLLIVALAVILLFAFLISSVSDDKQEELLLKLYLQPEDAVQMEASDLTLPKEEAVYGADGKTVLGYLDSDYEGGEVFLVVRVTAGTKGSDRIVGQLRLFIGQTVNIRCGDVRLYGLTVKEMLEVTGND